MTSQQLADRLAELAGWFPTSEGWARKDGPHSECPLGFHPYEVGSLDALERWRGEWLNGWEWACVFGPTGMEQLWTSMLSADNKFDAEGAGPDEWTARAAALIAAKESSMNKDTTAPKGAPPQPKEPKK
jgi:hypothetical protein